MFGSVGAWFYQALTGINVDTEQPGYRHIRIEPQVVRDLTWASGTVETLRGTVSSTWSHSPGVITLDVVVPVNSVATIVIPKEEQMTEVTIREADRIVWEKGHYVAGAPGIQGAKVEHDNFAFEVGSGRYSFRLTGQ
jgi:alpha-L-rhamnosidase